MKSCSTPNQPSFLRLYLLHLLGVCPALNAYAKIFYTILRSKCLCYQNYGIFYYFFTIFLLSSPLLSLLFYAILQKKYEKPIVFFLLVCYTQNSLRDGEAEINIILSENTTLKTDKGKEIANGYLYKSTKLYQR